MGSDIPESRSEAETPKQATEEKHGKADDQFPALSNVPPSQITPAPTKDAKHGDTPPWKIALEIVAVFIAFGLLIVNVFQLVATRDAADAAKAAANEALKANTLSERIIKGSEAAYLTYNIGPSPIGTLDSVQSGLGVGARNYGKVMAKNVDVECTLTIQAIPTYAPIGKSRAISIHRDRLRPFEFDKDAGRQTDHISVEYDMSSLSQSDLDAIHDLRQTIEVRGTLRFDNGFGETVTDAFCYLYATLRNKDGSPSGEGFGDCEEQKRNISANLRRNKQPR